MGHGKTRLNGKISKPLCENLLLISQQYKVLLLGIED